MMAEKTNGELAIMLENIDNNMKEAFEKNTGTHEKLFEKLEETNVRVYGLEKWKYMFAGGFIILSAIVIPLILHIIYKSYL